jgi:hypothetical protein
MIILLMLDHSIKEPQYELSLYILVIYIIRKHQWTKIIGGEKEQKQERKMSSMKTRKEIVRRRYIVRGVTLCQCFQKGRERTKAGEKDHKHEDKGRNGHKGSMSVSINAKVGYCWKVGFH